MANYILMHRHESQECAQVAAAWRGVETGLRRRRPLDWCATVGHREWWIVKAPDRGTALSLLPPYIADRTAARELEALPHAEEPNPRYLS
jgi:hypothetical protein